MRKTWGLVAVAGALVAGCSPSKQDVASVNGAGISRDDLTTRLMQSPAAHDTLRTLILERLLQDEANKKNVKVSDDDVNQFLQVQKDQFPPGRFEETVLKTTTTEALRQQSRLRLLVQGLSTQNAKVSDDSIQKFYNQNAVLFNKPEWKQVGFLLTKDRADADKAMAALKKGADFNTVSQQFTVDPAAKRGGVQFRWFGIQSNQVFNEQRQPVELNPRDVASVGTVRTALIKTQAGKLSGILAVAGAPYGVILQVKADVPASKIPMAEVKNQIAYQLAVKNNQVNPDVVNDVVKNGKVSVKMDEFKDLEKPEVLLPPPAATPAAQAGQ